MVEEMASVSSFRSYTVVKAVMFYFGIILSAKSLVEVVSVLVKFSAKQCMYFNVVKFEESRKGRTFI